MNKSAIKNFAVTARIKLIEAIEQKAYELGITKKEIKELEVYKDGFRVNDQFFKKYQMKQRNKLIQKINDQGFDPVIEEVAYTWFNRLIAIRFMEVNEYLPTGVRVLSSTESGKIEPDAVTDVLTIADELELDVEVVYRLQDENNSEELFKYIFVKQCNKLGEILPMMFEQIEDYTELLLPDRLLAEGSVVRDLLSMIEEENWKEQVEIIGWLYQYYISEKKDEVFNDLKKNKKIAKENIPAATQLFTPKWIVQYMVENSLGRLWLDSHPNDEMKSGWCYYLDQQDREHDSAREVSPEDIKFLDPCMGSGHILVYAFDVLYQIYKSVGYSEREIPQLIIEKNLFGLDIDDRAAQLAYFALLMKARSYDRRIFRKKLEVNVCSIIESNELTDEAVHLFDEKCILEVRALVKVFEDAKNYGAILKVNEINFDLIEEGLEKLNKDEGYQDIFGVQDRDLIVRKIPLLLKQARMMEQKYDVVVTNPPYMGNKGINDKLKDFIVTHYDEVKADLFSVFIMRNFDYCTQDGYLGFMTPFVWMFIPTYRKLREHILETKSMTSLIQLEYSGFTEATVPICTFTLKNNVSNNKGQYIKLSDFKGAENQDIKTREAMINPSVGYRYSVDNRDFLKIPNSPFIYWLGSKFLNLFQLNTLKDLSMSDGQTKTGDNNKFLRLLWEVDSTKVGKGKKWVFHAKGGPFRKWYGNIDTVIDWSPEARNHYRKDRVARITPEYLWFRKGITWNLITSSPKFAVRLLEEDTIFNLAGPSIFIQEEEETEFYLSVLNSKVSELIIRALNPTLNTNIGDVQNVPIKDMDQETFSLVKRLGQENIQLSKNDWNSFETAWGFETHPFIKYKTDSSFMKDAYANFESMTELQFKKLKENEERINQILIGHYDLAEEISPEVAKEDVTVRRADTKREIKSFLSYAIGCMFGRYSNDKEGLVYAGGELDQANYVSYRVVEDNIIPLTDDEYFEGDIVNRFVDFVRATFGEETLEENLDFIAGTLSMKAGETARQRIRRYYVNEFYKDHLQTYQKRPIYWLFESGKNDGFKVLVYLHRYDAATVAKVRTDYLHTLQRKYEAEMTRLDMLLEADVSAQEKTKAKKQKEKLQKQLLECQQYDQVIAHVANQKIALDIDDGVKVNYEKFQNIEVPQGEGKKAIKANLLAKI